MRPQQNLSLVGGELDRLDRVASSAGWRPAAVSNGYSDPQTAMRARIARFAFELGLEILEADPTLLNADR